MNRVFLIGNLTRDAELSETSNGTSVCKFSIAVRRRFAREEETDFFNCTAWKGLAENIAKYCKKGNKLAVTGRIEMRQYEDSHGVKKTAVEVVAEEAEFLSPRSENEPKKKPELQEFDEDDDIPF